MFEILMTEKVRASGFLKAMDYYLRLEKKKACPPHTWPKELG
jgi:hypothetical protein